MKTFYVKFSTSKLKPLSLPARNSIDAARRLMQAQTAMWKDHPDDVNVMVRFASDGEDWVTFKCSEVHVPGVKTPDALCAEMPTLQETLFPLPDGSSIGRPGRVKDEPSKG